MFAGHMENLFAAKARIRKQASGVFYCLEKGEEVE